jgi:hypothetical protein
MVAKIRLLPNLRILQVRERYFADAGLENEKAMGQQLAFCLCRIGSSERLSEFLPNREPHYQEL